MGLLSAWRFLFCVLSLSEPDSASPVGRLICAATRVRCVLRCRDAPFHRALIYEKWSKIRSGADGVGTDSSRCHVFPGVKSHQGHDASPSHRSGITASAEQFENPFTVDRKRGFSIIWWPTKWHAALPLQALRVLISFSFSPPRRHLI